MITFIPVNTKCSECNSSNASKKIIHSHEVWICDDCCELTLISNEPLEAVAPCQECGEEVPESEACGDGNDWFCPDCYGEQRQMKEMVSRFQLIAKKNHERIVRIVQNGPGEALLFLKERNVKWSHQKALGLFRKCESFVAQYPKPYAVERFDNPWHGEHLGFFYTSLNSAGPEWNLNRCAKVRGGE